MLERDQRPFCQQLRQCRDRAGLSQLALAVQAGTSLRHIVFLETGRLHPGVELVRQLADVLSISVAERSRLLVAAEISDYSSLAVDDGNVQLTRR
jgi:transcriptional regulator with XRE-family HTH domain